MTLGPAPEIIYFKIENPQFGLHQTKNRIKKWPKIFSPAAANFLKFIWKYSVDFIKSARQNGGRGVQKHTLPLPPPPTYNVVWCHNNWVKTAHFLFIAYFWSKCHFASADFTTLKKNCILFTILYFIRIKFKIWVWKILLKSNYAWNVENEKNI